VTSERIPAFSDTAAQIHPRVADIESLSVAWMCDMGLLPRPGLREEVTQGRLCAWACYFYPYADFGYGLLVACWWAWWTYLDDLAMKLDYAAWLKLSADMERVFWHGGGISSDPRSPSPQRQTLTALGDLCRRTFELSTPALYQLIAIGGCDALSGFTMEAFNRHIRRTPGTDLALSADCEYLHTHRKTIGMFIDTAWIEGAVGFAVPEAVRCTPAWQDALETAYDVMILQNDLNGFPETMPPVMSTTPSTSSTSSMASHLPMPPLTSPAFSPHGSPAFSTSNASFLNDSNTFPWQTKISRRRRISSPSSKPAAKVYWPGIRRPPGTTPLTVSNQDGRTSLNVTPRMADMRCQRFLCTVQAC
jgi:hypothetical protein